MTYRRRTNGLTQNRRAIDLRGLAERARSAVREEIPNMCNGGVERTVPTMSSCHALIFSLQHHEGVGA